MQARSQSEHHSASVCGRPGADSSDGRSESSQLDSATKIRFVAPQDKLAAAGKLHVVVKNPTPLATEEWGDTSNTAHILVPFAFTQIVAGNIGN